MKKNLINLLLITLTLHTMNAQNLDGKWILKDMESNGKKDYPWSEHLVIKGDSIESTMNLHGTIRQHQLIRSNNEFLNLDKSHYGKYELKDSTNLLVTSEGNSNGVLMPWTWHYLKLHPTITNLESSEFKNFKYKLYAELNQPNIMPLDMTLTNENCEYVKEGDTYFIYFKSLGNNSPKFPIKEITEDYIIIYGFPMVDENYIKALRVE